MVESLWTLKSCMRAQQSRPLSKIRRRRREEHRDGKADRHRDFLNAKTTDPATGQWFFTHRRLRSALRSLHHNLPHLFTYQRFPELNVPTTTNALEAHFSHLKDVVRIHRGLALPTKRKVIQAILLNSSIVLKSKRNY